MRSDGSPLLSRVDAWWIQWKKKKSPKRQLDAEIDQEIDQYVDGLEFEENSFQNTIESPKTKKERMKIEIKEAVKLPELSQNLESAIKLLLSEGATYLSEEANATLLSDFSNASTFLTDMKLAGIGKGDMDLQELIKISDESMKSIVVIAIAKFAEEKYADCLSLFTLLTILNPAYSEYWIRLGLAAQKSGNFDLALRAYAATLMLDPNLIEARLFAAECHVERNDLDKAKTELSEAKKIAAQIKVDQQWLDLIPIIESTIKGN